MPDERKQAGAHSRLTWPYFVMYNKVSYYLYYLVALLDDHVYRSGFVAALGLL